MPAPPASHSLMASHEADKGDGFVRAQAKVAPPVLPRQVFASPAVPTFTEPNPYAQLLSDNAQRSDEAPPGGRATQPGHLQRPTSEATPSDDMSSLGTTSGSGPFPGRTPNPSPAASSALDVNAPAFVPQGARAPLLVSKPGADAPRQVGTVRPPPPPPDAVVHDSRGFGGARGQSVVAFEELDSRRKAVYERLRSLVRARTMAEHKQSLAAFSEHINWDVPPLLVNDREQMRVIVYLAKFAADLDFTPEAVMVETLPDGREVLHTLLTFHLWPKRPWFTYPAALLLPDCLNIKATVNITTAPRPGNGDEIQRIWGRIHNAPAFPNLIRHLNAFGMGTLGKLTEPLWSHAMWMCGDDSYSNGAADRVAGYPGSGSGSGSGGGSGYGGYSGAAGAEAGFGPKSHAVGFESVGKDPGGAEGVPYQRME